jgi:hypothetical protein
MRCEDGFERKPLHLSPNLVWRSRTRTLTMFNHRTLAMAGSI